MGMKIGDKDIDFSEEPFSFGNIEESRRVSFAGTFKKDYLDLIKKGGDIKFYLDDDNYIEAEVDTVELCKDGTVDFVVKNIRYIMKGCTSSI